MYLGSGGVIFGVDKLADTSDADDVLAARTGGCGCHDGDGPLARLVPSEGFVPGSVVCGLSSPNLGQFVWVVGTVDMLVDGELPLGCT